jgi:hypothetical protein
MPCTTKRARYAVPGIRCLEIGRRGWPYQCPCCRSGYCHPCVAARDKGQRAGDLPQQGFRGLPCLAICGRGSGNSRNGFSSKTVIGDDGAIELAVPARPQWQLRAAARAEGSDPARRFRRSDHQPLCPGPLGPRDPGASARALRRPIFPRSGQPGHRCRARGGAGMAEPAARPGLPGDFLRRAAGQDSRRRSGAQQRRMFKNHRPRRSPRSASMSASGHQRSPSPPLHRSKRYTGLSRRTDATH